MLLIQLLVSFQIYSNISRLSLLARGNSLSLAYFYSSVALKGGVCTLEIAMPNSRYINETAGRSSKGQVELVLLWNFVECGNRKALRLRVQGVYLCK